MIWIWLKRLLFANLKTSLSLAGLALGVACLIVTMTVMSSYKTTLTKILVDRTGHIIIVKKGKGETKSALLKKTSPLLPPFQSYVPFISIEALALNQGSLSGIILEGLDTADYLKDRFVQGGLFHKANQAIVGTKLADHLNLKVGSVFSIAVSQWNHSLENFSVVGIVDLGHHDFNSRYTAIPLSSAQKLTGQDGVTGLRFWLTEETFPQNLIHNLRQELGFDFWIQDWKFINKNLFTAIEMEKTIIFFILLVLIIAAGFNISNQLFIDVLKRFREIGILKAMGAKPFLIAQLFLIQCLVISIIGTLIGFALGSFISYILFVSYNIWEVLVPADIYKLNKIILDFRWQDFAVIFIFSISTCLFGSLIPIKKALSLTPREGLGYE